MTLPIKPFGPGAFLEWSFSMLEFHTFYQDMSDSSLLLFSLLLLYAWCILLIWKLKSFFSSGKRSSIISCFPLNSCMDCSITYSGLCSDATLSQTPSSPIPSKTAHLLPSFSWPLFILLHDPDLYIIYWFVSCLSLPPGDKLLKSMDLSYFKMQITFLF